MSELLALASAVMFGLGDLTGGYTTRRLSVWTVMLWSQLVGVLVLGIGFLLVPVDSVTAGDIGFGALGGISGLFGLAILYAALSRGKMSLIAPITGATTAILPVAFDLSTGGSLSRVEWIGISLGVAAVVLLGLDITRTRLGRRELVLAVGAGVAFAIFFIAFAETHKAAGLWPVVGARAVSLPLTVLIAVRVGAVTRPKGRNRSLVATAGTLDMSANIAVLLALQRGSLAISSVLSSLYPAVTAIAAVALLRERPSRTQSAGIGVAVAAVIALAA